MTGPLVEAGGEVRLLVRAQPGAKRDEIAGLHGERLKIRVTAPPEDGRANEHILALVAEAFHLRTRDVTLVAGAKSRSKALRLGGMTLHDAVHALQSVLKRAAAATD